ncbi:MAG TPA: M15 family metallopeptidase [Nocardioides sp.]|nr:M15 family metallopeptidase [Nocardioides sp.]HQR27179.1 M15 family metallopeptidase [Nocardioides sp.]
MRPASDFGGDVVVEAFEAIGWEWGGSWTPPDYQHFQAPRPTHR